MASNKTEQAREWLEEQGAGAFVGVIDYCLQRGGVVHCSQNCFLAGFPCEDDARCLHVVFQCSELPALRRLLLALPYDRVRWRRDYGHGERYGTRERAIADFCRHEDFGTGLTKSE